MTRDELVQALRERARLVYDGKQVAHRSCGVAVAETFGRETRPYQALRRGGITGAGVCGAIVAGQLVLGDLFGDPAPAAPATPRLREALTRYQAEVARRLATGPGGSYVCNDLTSPFADFQSPARHDACTDLTATVAEIVADIAIDLGAPLALGPAPTA